MTSFDPHPDETLRSARARYFNVNQFGPNGGYDEAWVKVKVGRLTLSIPNTKGRVRAVRFHDLHHILTEYDTDLRGEAEIAAWEIASGCADHYAAWVLNLGAMSFGAILIPQRTWRAFLRGRKTKNLYRENFDETLLEHTVAEIRARLGLDKAQLGQTEIADVGMYAASIFAATMTGATIGLLKAPIAALLLLMSAVQAVNESGTQSAAT